MNRNKYAVETLMDKADVHIDGSNPWDLQVHNDRFYKALLSKGELGLAESYMEGWWDCDQIDELLLRLIRSGLKDELKNHWGIMLRVLRAKIINMQNLGRSTVVGKRHYDLSNEFYELMLGESMAYTCAYWKGASSLDEAQNNKYDLACRKLKIQPGDHVLEHGIGWGGFARFAVENYGCQIVGMTISARQIEYAQVLCKDLPVRAILSDYRDVEKYNPDGRKFDKVVSMGMCEHIGWKNYAGWFKIINLQLKDGGLFLLHSIGAEQSITAVSRFNHKYIFPNAHVPSMSQLASAAEGVLVVEDFHNFGHEYYRTLQEWQNNFANNWSAIQQLDSQFDDTFYRMWNFYLFGGMALSKSKSRSLWQIVFSKPGSRTVYEGVR